MTETTETISLADSAVEQIKKIITKDPDHQGAYLRVMVVGGGCSGMSYKLDFDKKPPSDKDQVLELKGVKVVVDRKSLLFLKGSTLEYSGGLNGRGFEFSNPNATRTCGCGSSFST